MTLAEAFVAVARAGGRFVVEGGSIFLDLPPGGPPVPQDVLAVLSNHRDDLLAAAGGRQPAMADGDEREAIRWADRRPNATADEALAQAIVEWAALATPGLSL